MKKILLAALSISLITTSCTKEEEVITPVTTPTDPVETITFTCKIDGVDYDGSNSIDAAIAFDFLTITTSNGSNSVAIKIPGISMRNNGDEISFLGAIGYGVVSTPTLTYSNTNFDASKGGITITEIDFTEGKISGTFFFEAQDVTPNEFGKVNVTSGAFNNISF